jgi:cellulose synthase/poly-beta-1,6-N-acetylglucosamine synthase-like glycosyltransferase
MARPGAPGGIAREAKNNMHQRQPDKIYVSVIVPAFNVEPFIEECLRSVFERSVERMEVIVVDDGSTDKTREVVESLTPPEGKSLKLISSQTAVSPPSGTRE